MDDTRVIDSHHRNAPAPGSQLVGAKGIALRNLPRRRTDGITDLGLRGVLSVLGGGLSVGSRFLPSLRAQITRSLVFEISAGPDVARHWTFDGPRRRVSSTAGPAPQPHGALRFDSSARALRRLLSPRAVEGIVEDWHHGHVTVQGSAALLLWFSGVTRKLVKIGATPGPTAPLPGAYLHHDPGACGTETILIEPVTEELDPQWSGAWRARALLPSVRATTGEPVTP